MIKFFVRATLITLGCVALLAIVGAGYLHYGLIKPLAQRTIVEHPDDLAFVGGLLAFSCIVPDFLALSDDIDETMETAKSLKDQTRQCRGSFSSFANCAVSLTEDAFDSDKRKRAVAYAKKAKHTYTGVRKMLSDARRIARNLPAYDDKTRAIKTVLVKVATHFAQMNMMDFLRLDEEEQEAWFEAAFAPYESQADEWMEEAETRYADLEPIGAIIWGAHQVSPVLSNLIMWNLNQYGFDEIMQRAPSFRFARQRGCLQGTTLLDAAEWLIQKVEESEQLKELAVTDDEQPPCYQ